MALVSLSFALYILRPLWGPATVVVFGTGVRFLIVTSYQRRFWPYGRRRRLREAFAASALGPRILCGMSLLALLYGIIRQLKFTQSLGGLAALLVYTVFYYMLARVITFASTTLVGDRDTIKSELLLGGAALLCLGLVLYILLGFASVVVDLNPIGAWAIHAWGLLLAFSLIFFGLAVIFVSLPRTDLGATEGELRPLPRT